MARRVSLRPAGFDELGLRRALADRMLPFLVAAMAFLAALGLAGWVGAAALARHWQSGPAAALTVQVPDPDEDSRLARALALIQGSPGVTTARALSAQELGALLRPWLGTQALGTQALGTQALGTAALGTPTGGGPALDAGTDTPALPLPGVIAVKLADPDMSTDALARRLDALAPGTEVESHGPWVGRLAALARSLQACAGAALLVLAAIASAVIAVATRAGLAARREAIEIVHGLGASDGYIAGRFAARATALAATGALAGGLAATPILMVLAYLAAPFAGTEASADGFGTLPAALWMLLPGLPLAAASIGFLTAQTTVRRWLRRLP